MRDRFNILHCKGLIEASISRDHPEASESKSWMGIALMVVRPLTFITPSLDEK